MPVPQVTSMTFGGKGYDTMFVTTAGMEVTTKQTYPAGYLFKVTGFGTTRGVETTRFVTV
jgi:sugar lactone lactonase YvrE